MIEFIHHSLLCNKTIPLNANTVINGETFLKFLSYKARSQCLIGPIC